MPRFIAPLFALMFAILAHISGVSTAFASPPQCSDGIDNDGDKSIDYLMELPRKNGERFSIGGTGDPFLVMNAVAAEIRKKKLPRSVPTNPILRSTGASGAHFKWTDSGNLNFEVLNEVCRIFGYSTYVGSSCLDTERSHRYPNGKCNFHSPHNNQLSQFNGIDFINRAAEEKYANTWLASIECKDRLSACDDGVDNDNDGATDFPADKGCASRDDDSEKPHDPDCTDAHDPSEAPACSDGIDNDQDGAADYPADFSCSNKSDNDEEHPKAQCQDGIDNDHDSLIDQRDPGCSNNQDNDEGNDPTPTSTPTPTCVSTNTPKPTKTPTPTPTPTCISTSTPKPTRTPTPTPTCVTTTTPKATHTPTPKPTRTPTPPPATVEPVVDCVERIERGKFLAFFGYRLEGLNDVEIPLGLDNAVYPPPTDRGQPSTFRAGGVANAFSAQFADSATWVLQGKYATADASSPRCNGCKGAACVAACVKRDGRAELANLTESTQQYYRITMQLFRAYIEVLRSSKMQTERRLIRGLRDEAIEWQQAQSVALAELGRHDWYSCASESCETIDFSPYAKTLDRATNELARLQQEIVSSWQTSGLSMSEELTVLTQEGDGLKASILKELENLPAFVSKCN